MSKRGFTFYRLFIEKGMINRTTVKILRFNETTTINADICPYHMIELNEWVVQIIENEVNEDIEIVKKSVQKS